MRIIRNEAFTLIELLLVVAIILVLSGLLYPMVSAMMEKGRSTRCVANLRQLQVAAMNFAGCGELPRPVSSVRVNRDIYTGQILSYTHLAGWVSWYSHTDLETHRQDDFTKKYGWQTTDSGVISISKGTLWSAANNLEIYLCPTVARNKNCRKAVRSYSMNAAAGSVSILGTGNTLTVLFGDDATLPPTGTVVGQAQDVNTDGGFATNNLWRIHQGRGNVVYIDGHVESW